VHVDDVDIVEGHTCAIKRYWGGECWTHQELPVRIDRCKGVRPEVGLGCVPESLGDRLVHEQQRRSTVGQRRRVGSRDRTVLAVEHRLEACEFLDRRVCPGDRVTLYRVLVPRRNRVGHHLVVENPRFECFDGLGMGSEGKLVLSFPCDAVLFGHLFG